MRSAFFVTLSLLSAVASADTIVRKVVSVADANTIVVVDSEYLRQKIRIRSIRAPQKNELLADEVKNYLSTLLLGKRVTVYWDTWDRYGRMMGKVVTDEGDVAALLLQSGMAALNPGDLAQMQPFERDKYTAAERSARRDGLGIWSAISPRSTLGVAGSAQ